MCPRRIEEDHKDFRDVYGGRIRKALKKFVNNGTIFRTRPNGQRVPITIPKMDIPHIVHGDNGEGVGRGKGKKGDIIKKGPKDGQGNGAGQGEGDGIIISLDLEEVLKFLQDELQLPDLKPKPNETFEEEELKYTSISLVGPQSLIHRRRTMIQALKRHAATGDLNKLHWIPGFDQPVQLITPINSDRRYRQYKIIKKPASNAVIFFARDGSASMDQYKCDIVSDMCWWIDIWIRRFYKRVERCYVWHDTNAAEVDENKFYRYRYGGGTICSSALKLIGKQFESRFPPNKWNFYVFYFTDGENWHDDNKEFVNTIKEQFPPDTVNFVGITQVMAGAYQDSLKQYVDKELASVENIRTTAVGIENNKQSSQNNYGYSPQLSDEERDSQIKKAIIDLLGAKKPSKKADSGQLTPGGV
jgi:hypothetical protein